jgi:thioredoxin reductase (NADPH)
MPIETDGLIVGAGPVGLFQAFQLGLQDVRVHIVDALPYAGGQCIALYADKPIYDIPGIPVCTGRALVAQLLQQVAPFAPEFHFGQIITHIHRQSDGRFLVEANAASGANAPSGTRFLTKTIFVAAGVGAFQPRTLKLDGAADLEGRQIYYELQADAELSGKHVVISGDGEQALHAALALARGNELLPDSLKRHISVLHRREVFTAEGSTIRQFKAMLDIGALHFVAGQITALHTSDQTLQSIGVLQSDGTKQALRCDQLLVLQGLSPKLGPIADWELAMERRQLKVDTESFSTDVLGIFAVGDINTYPGKKKLILCGFHECVLAAFGAMPIIRPAEKVLLQYTTTSSKLHRLLGVEHPGAS